MAAPWSTIRRMTSVGGVRKKKKKKDGKKHQTRGRWGATACQWSITATGVGEKVKMVKEVSKRGKKVGAGGGGKKRATRFLFGSMSIKGSKKDRPGSNKEIKKGGRPHSTKGHQLDSWKDIKKYKKAFRRSRGGTGTNTRRAAVSPL